MGDRYDNFSGKRFQFSKDLFHEWKNEQNAAVAARGADADPAVEEEHNSFMLRQNLNAYICYKQLDEYTACLQEKNLISDRGGSGGAGFEINTKNRVNEKLCRSTHSNYVSCLSSQRNQEDLLANAATHAHCAQPREDLFHCMEMNNAVETKTHEAQCEPQYRRTIRCGLNHLWNDYWRAMTKVTDADEFHLYELSRDDCKRQEYLRVITTGEEALRQQRADKRDREQGYFLNPQSRRE